MLELARADAQLRLAAWIQAHFCDRGAQSWEMGQKVVIANRPLGEP